MSPEDKRDLDWALAWTLLALAALTGALHWWTRLGLSGLFTAVALVAALQGFSIVWKVLHRS